MPLGRMRTSSQAAEQLGTTQRYVITLVERGKLKPADKLPGRTGAYLFDADEIDAYAARRRQACGKAGRAAA